jgi:hypothetical protein
MAGPQFFTAKEAFTTELEGYGPVVIQKGENVRAGHPLIEQNPERFQPVEISSRWDTVEQATAAPGEKRRTGRRARAHKPVGRTGLPPDPSGVSETPDDNTTKETV